MHPEAALVAAGALATSTVLTGVVRRFALAHGLIDMPNVRSSHGTPTPRGGGLSIVLAVTLALAVLAAMGMFEMRLFLALAGGGLAVAVVGFIDDRYRVTAGVRLAAHCAPQSGAWRGLEVCPRSVSGRARGPRHCGRSHRCSGGRVGAEPVQLHGRSGWHRGIRVRIRSLGGRSSGAPCRVLLDGGGEPRTRCRLPRV